MTDNAEAKGNWQGEIDCLRSHPTLSAIRAHAMAGGRAPCLDRLSLEREASSPVNLLRSFKRGGTALRWVIRSIEALDARLSRFYIQPLNSAV